MDEQEQAEIAMLMFQHRDTLTPLFARCQGERDRLAVVYALRDLVAHPDNRGAHERWGKVLRTLQAV